VNIGAIITQLSSYGEFSVCVFCSDKARQHFCVFFRTPEGWKVSVIISTSAVANVCTMRPDNRPYIVHEIDQILVTNRWVGATVVFLNCVSIHTEKDIETKLPGIYS